MGKFTSAVILAAGNGTRYGGEVKKQFSEIDGVPCLVYSVKAFDNCRLIDEIILVGNEDEINGALSSYNFQKPHKIVAGGKVRQDSALLGFDAISEKATHVAIHDAARCLVTEKIIEDTVSAAFKTRAAAAAHKSEDTVKIADKNGIIEKTEDRDKVWSVQTPQVFSADVYRVASYMAKKDGATVTDDCMLCERLGFEVKLVECGRNNIKLTNPDDRLLAEAIIMQRKAAER